MVNMKSKIAILMGISLFLGCVMSKEVENISIDKRILYPIGENNKWGYANSEGETVIEPIYEKVEFFMNGLALVKLNGKYGYIKNDGYLHIKAKYDSATSFISNCASVSVKNDTFLINRQGRKMKRNDCRPIDDGGCNVVQPANPNDYFIQINGKNELVFKYYVKIDTSNIIEVIDTSNLKIDEIIPYGNSHILLRKNDKYGLFDIWSCKRIIVDEAISSNHEREANFQLSNLIKFKYDDVFFNRSLQNEVSYAKVRINDKYGVINSRGDIVLQIEFDSLEIEPGWQMALVEFESNKFGYKSFGGKEFFKRRENK